LSFGKFSIISETVTAELDDARKRLVALKGY
jgi:hypothetical protein